MRHWLSVLIKAAMTVVILVLVAWQLDFRTIAQSLSTISPFASVAAVLVVLVQSLIVAQRLAILVLAKFGARFRLLDFFASTFL